MILSGREFFINAMNFKASVFQKKIIVKMKEIMNNIWDMNLSKPSWKNLKEETDKAPSRSVL
jgi:hypothetical protein